MEFYIVLDGQVIDTATTESSAVLLVAQYNQEHGTNDVDYVTVSTIQ